MKHFKRQTASCSLTFSPRVGKILKDIACNNRHLAPKMCSFTCLWTYYLFLKAHRCPGLPGTDQIIKIPF